MIQKIIKVGNSAGVTIPKEYFTELRLKIGQPVLVDFDSNERIIKINPKPKIGKKSDKRLSSMSLTPEFIAWANKFIADNKELFKELARQ